MTIVTIFGQPVDISEELLAESFIKTSGNNFVQNNSTLEKIPTPEQASSRSTRRVRFKSESQLEQVYIIEPHGQHHETIIKKLPTLIRTQCQVIIHSYGSTKEANEETVSEKGKGVKVPQYY
jgi:hypothetical protein